MDMDRVRRFGGIALLAMAIAIAVQVVLSGAAGDMSSDRDEIRTTLSDIHDNEGLWIAAAAVDVVCNTLTIVVAAALFVLLQDGTQLRRTLGLAGMIGGGVLFLGQDGANLVLARLAGDAAAGVNADTVAEVARTVMMISWFQFVLGFTVIGVGFVGFNLLILRMPKTEGSLPIAVPRWIGWLGLAAALDMWLSWLAVANSDLFIVSLPGLIGSLVWMVGLGVVLLRAGERSVVVAEAAPARA